MTRFILIILFTLTLCGLTFAKSPLPEFEKVKEIKLLESTRDDVRKILGGYNLDSSAYSDNFSTKDAYIKIDYSRGTCINDADE